MVTPSFVKIIGGQLPIGFTTREHVKCTDDDGMGYRLPRIWSCTYAVRINEMDPSEGANVR
jgi:hypothetical protein